LSKFPPLKNGETIDHFSIQTNYIYKHVVNGETQKKSSLYYKSRAYILVRIMPGEMLCWDKKGKMEGRLSEIGFLSGVEKHIRTLRIVEGICLFFIFSLSIDLGPTTQRGGCIALHFCWASS
jgi:hypothetical protein